MRIIRKATVLIILLIAIPSIDVSCIPSTHDDAFTEQGLLEADTSDLQHTTVTAHLDTAIAGGKNALWCGSFQLAWNAACSLVGEDLRFGDKEPAVVALLNKKSFTGRHLDEESYVAVAGFVRDDVHGQIARQLERKFKGRATPRYVPPKKELTPRPQDIVAYAYLFKNLEFTTPFERIGQPILFGTASVPCFGIAEEYKPEHIGMLKQVTLWSYRGKDDFVIELKTKNGDDRLVLAKVQPEATLAETVATVQSCVAKSKPEQPRVGDVLKVPKLNFDLTRRYDELEGKNLVVTNPDIAKDLMIVSALQNVRFELDEQGVRLRSESHVSFGCSREERRPSSRRMMILDKPFLLMLQRRTANVPYFAIWIADPELLVKVTNPSSS